MSLRGWLIGGSLAAHGIMVVALGGIRAPAEILATAIEVTETKAKKEEPPPPREPPPEPPKPPEPKQVTKAAAEAPPPDVAPAESPSPMANLPDFGLELSGGSGAANGLAMPAGGDAHARPPPPKAVQKTLEKAAAPPKPVDACDEPPAKPKLVNLPQPAYTDAARAAGIEGKIRVQLTVDEAGRVIDAKALTSLGHGLDEAALAAARAATFEAAVRCGKPSRSTFTIAIRFAAS